MISSLQNASDCAVSLSPLIRLHSVTGTELWCRVSGDGMPILFSYIVTGICDARGASHRVRVSVRVRVSYCYVTMYEKKYADGIKSKQLDQYYKETVLLLKKSLHT